MNSHVFSPWQEVTKGFPTLFTFVRFLHHVVLLVQVKVGLPSEGFSTLCAFIGFLSSVVPDMLFEMWGVLESLPTVMTFIRSLSSVCSSVCNKVAAPAICFPTFITLVRSLPRVNSHVYLQGGEGSECISTLTAVKGLLCEVSSCMTPKGGGVIESFPTGTAFVGFLPSVYSPVPCEGSTRGEGFLALMAFMHLPPIVNAHMLGYRWSVFEGYPTVPAVVGPLASVPSRLLSKMSTQAEDFKQVSIFRGFLSMLSSFHCHPIRWSPPKNIFHKNWPFGFRWSLPIGTRASSVKPPLLCPQLLFLLQVGDKAGFAHLTPYSRGKTHVEGGPCRVQPLPLVWGLGLGLQFLKMDKSDLGAAKGWCQISKEHSERLS